MIKTTELLGRKTTTSDFVRVSMRLMVPFLLVASIDVLVDDRPSVHLTEQARNLHASTVLFDGHNDLPWAFRGFGMPGFDKLDIAKSQPGLHTDIPRLRKSSVLVGLCSREHSAERRIAANDTGADRVRACDGKAISGHV